MRKIILASTSPRRKKLLSRIGLPFEVQASDYEEDMKLDLTPKELVKHLSKGKAEAVAKNYEDAIVIGADSIVVHKNEVFGKPTSTAEAKEMLKKLSGTVHSVITGFTIIDTKTNKSVSQAIEAKIYFREVTEEEMDAYIKTGEPMDKAGAYAVQGLGAIFVEKIEGDFTGVIGLPLFALAKELKNFGAEVLQ